MAAVHVTTENNEGQKVTFLLDDEREADQERIDYFRKLVRRDDLRDVKVTEPGQKGTSRGAAKSGGNG
ncbi:hypothetical protein [Amycolatopsis orientalis]|uniref:hypothetical protein n=1 Tax=Amycolatopsis orientalis TaxID=31958 RepID=UPI0003A3F9A1|nr:hypothetical protein [Amycolatopsis orientalis]